MHECILVSLGGLFSGFLIAYILEKRRARNLLDESFDREKMKQ